MNRDEDWIARGAELERYMREAIPMVVHMQVRVLRCDAAGLSLAAPLAPNINHKLSAFGGSLSSLATLACWGVLWLRLRDLPDTHIVVSESHMTYLHPVTQELAAHCNGPAEGTLKKFRDTLARRGRARLQLRSQLIQDGVVCGDYTGSFVAYRRPTD